MQYYEGLHKKQPFFSLTISYGFSWPKTRQEKISIGFVFHGEQAVHFQYPVFRLSQ